MNKKVVTVHILFDIHRNFCYNYAQETVNRVNRGTCPHGDNISRLHG